MLGDNMYRTESNRSRLPSTFDLVAIPSTSFESFKANVVSAPSVDKSDMLQNQQQHDIQDKSQSESSFAGLEVKKQSRKKSISKNNKEHVYDEPMS